MIAILKSTFFIWCICLVAACSSHPSEQKLNEKAKEIKDSAASCKPIKDPNNPKPMALMMRQMALNADSMRAQLIRGEFIDSLKYPFLRFYMVEPTDPEVLQPQFYENARLFQLTYKNQFHVSQKEQISAYNATIAACIHCHESYCNGPLKKIRKLPIP
jgi:hypothetical protein